MRRNPLALFSFLFRQLFFLRGLFLLGAYTVIFVCSLFLAYQLRFDFDLPPQYLHLFLENLIWVIPLKLVLMFAFGQFAGLLSYFRLPDLYRIFFALSLNAVFLLYLWYVTDPASCPPRSVILADFGISLLGIVGFRVSLRVLRERYFSGGEVSTKKAENVAIVGAGDVGSTIAADLLARRGLGMRPVVFLDDNRSKWRKHVHGIPVVDSPDRIEWVKSQYGIRRVIIAMPEAPAPRVREIVHRATDLDLKVEIVPSLVELTTGRVRANRIRPVEVQDLLGRDSVSLDSDEIGRMIRDEVVLVTGAGGSIGAELAAQIAGYQPKRLLLVDQAEVQLFNLENRLLEEGHGHVFMPLVANVLDEERMRAVLKRHRPALIVHAAAHKHVPILEHQPSEALKNNTYATVLLADLAVEYGVARFVLVSSDKAINPRSVMGASKRLAEIYLQARQGRNEHRTRFMAVRFGNVLGSSGSVVPVFRQQIAAGGPVTVTHPQMKRYFMTIPEAAGLVLQCGTLGTGGEIFVLNMGTPIKILDLAHQMIQLSGFRPDVDIAIEFTGLRPGEKLFEELQHSTESHAETAHPKVLRFITTAPDYDRVRAFLDQLRTELYTVERNLLKERIVEMVPEYTPFLE